LTPLTRRIKKYPQTDAAVQYLRQTLWYRVGYTPSMKIEGHGQAKILTQEEIELLFNEGLQSDRDRASLEFASTPLVALPKRAA
jgi:hypothetical protein